MQGANVLKDVEPLLPEIRARREEIERARRLPRDLADALGEKGLFSLEVPRAIGGTEATPEEVLRVIETISAADGSTGWCAMVGIVNNLSAGYMGEEGAREVFGTGRAPSAGIAAPTGAAERVDSGVRIRGKWAFASGITHSDWVWAGCVVMENGSPRMTETGPEVIHVCIPVADVQLEDTWHVSGLCGTGSIDFSIDDAFVPERRIFGLLDPSGHRPEPLYQLPALAWFVSHVAAVGLGIARGALDEVVEVAATKVPTLSRDVLADRPAAQLGIARAEAALGSARAFLYATVADLWDSTCAGATVTQHQIALNRLACVHAAETAADVARSANVLAGGGSIHLSSALQRHMRDADAVAHHFTVSPHVWEDAGRVLLGRQPATLVF